MAVGEQGRRDEARAPYPGKGRAPLAAGLPHAARMLARAVWHASLADRGPTAGWWWWGRGGERATVVCGARPVAGRTNTLARVQDEESANIQGSIRSRKVKLLFSYESVTAS